MQYKSDDIDAFQECVEQHGMGLHKSIPTKITDEPTPRELPEVLPETIELATKQTIVHMHDNSDIKGDIETLNQKIGVLSVQLDIANNRLENMEQLMLQAIKQQTTMSDRICQLMSSKEMPTQSRVQRVLRKLLSLGRGKVGR